MQSIDFKIKRGQNVKNQGHVRRSDRFRESFLEEG